MAERVGFDEEQSDEEPEREARRQHSLKITRSAPQSEIKAKSKNGGQFHLPKPNFLFRGDFYERVQNWRRALLSNPRCLKPGFHLKKTQNLASEMN